MHFIYTVPILLPSVLQKIANQLHLFAVGCSFFLSSISFFPQNHQAIH
ncbi:hypothetical protein LDG_6104 [Legionella drancourtii LLAP12]|uniref:Uncharacterized protein n=1 Tax=Legionella drancourtii LLAP12 TaxID=658187 RepID=G9EL46_9GAMM|nr:hypothetical protein LDG_6104 [Legionella drancourtii LLAP12]